MCVIFACGHLLCLRAAWKFVFPTNSRNQGISVVFVGFVSTLLHHFQVLLRTNLSLSRQCETRAGPLVHAKAPLPGSAGLPGKWDYLRLPVILPQRQSSRLPRSRHSRRMPTAASVASASYGECFQNTRCGSGYGSGRRRQDCCPSRVAPSPARERPVSARRGDRA
jgi:hypothetical protein